MLKRIHDCCIEHLNEPLEVADLAAIAGMGPQRFGAAFKAATGRSPQQYLIGLRVDQARDLLVNSRLVIAEIALRCGFFDQSHLTTTFTCRVGVPPLRYRRQATR
jgi:AraC family transcriptional regulator